MREPTSWDAIINDGGDIKDLVELRRNFDITLSQMVEILGISEGKIRSFEAGVEQESLGLAVKYMLVMCVAADDHLGELIGPYSMEVNPLYYSDVPGMAEFVAYVQYVFKRDRIDLDDAVDSFGELNNFFQPESYTFKTK